MIGLRKDRIERGEAEADPQLARDLSNRPASFPPLRPGAVPDAAAGRISARRIGGADCSQMAAGSMLSARTMKVAIWARVTGRSGQYRSGAEAQPLVTPAW